MTNLLRAHKSIVAILLAFSATSAQAADPAGQRHAEANYERVGYNAARIAENQIELDNARMKYELAIGVVEGHVAAKEQGTLVQLHPDGKVSVKNAKASKEPEGSRKLEELTASDLELAERIWQVDQIHSMVTLRNLVANLEKSGLADDERTVSKAYWLLANAIYANHLSCDMAYQAMYKSITLGFTDHWPQQFSTYKNNLAALNSCVPADKRERLMAQAQASLDSTPLRNRVKPELAAAAGMTANAEGLASAPVSDAPAENRVSKALKTIVPTGIGIAIFIAALLVAGKIMGGSSGAPASSSGRTAHPKASEPGHKKRQVATSKRRVGMQRLNPWN